MIFWEYDDKKSREESGISKFGTDTLQGLLITTDIIDFMKLTTDLPERSVSMKKLVLFGPVPASL